MTINAHSMSQATSTNYTSPATCSASSLSSGSLELGLTSSVFGLDRSLVGSCNSTWSPPDEDASSSSSCTGERKRAWKRLACRRTNKDTAVVLGRSASASSPPSSGSTSTWTDPVSN
eukprot:scaffold31863_cov37-Attheya_sp.AAC.1